VLLSALSSACSSSPDVKKNQYGPTTSERTWEYEFPVVWKAIEEAFRNHKIKERDSDDVDAVELKKLTERSMKTDWIYSQSTDKYVTYTTRDKGAPSRVYLQLRYRIVLEAEKVMGGTQVRIRPEEEIQEVDEKGNPGDYVEVDEEDRDPRLSGRLLDRIEEKINARPNI